MHRYRFTHLLIALAVVVGLWGCDDSQNLTDPGFNEQDVSSGAEIVALVGPTAQTADQMMLDMIAQVAGTTAPLTTGQSVSLPGSTESFDLGNGITGTRELTANGVYTFRFAGTVDVDGAMIRVEGTLVLTPAATQPPSGAAFLIDYSADATGPRGSATWTATGNVEVGAGEVTDYDATMTHTVTATGGASAVATVMVSPTRFELVVTGPFGNTLRFVFDRSSMTGTLGVNGRDVALVTVSGGCTHVDYMDPARQDIDVCVSD